MPDPTIMPDPTAMTKPTAMPSLTAMPKPIRLALALFSALLLPAAVIRAAETPPLVLGSAWYPEQWTEADWEKDLALMKAAGFNMVRIGEFAWSSMEPEEGRYTFDWLEKAVAAAARHGMVVVLGTPTDAPPAWLTGKYPETLRVAPDGRRLQHGDRRQFNYSSRKYRGHCRAIVEQMARRFGGNPHVIGWQIGNEYTEDSFDDESRRAFHDWLREKYKSIDLLNRHWVTAYWSQAYNSWDQVPMNTGRNNPGLMLDYKRFVTDQWRGLQREQRDVIRVHAGARQFITTNLGGLGWANRFNRQLIASDLDLITWDNYVGSGHIEPYRNGATHDLVRGWKNMNFWVMEMQPGFVDWAQVSNSLDKGETRALVWAAVGHGADGIAFWQWRSALNGQEQYHGVLVGPDGGPVPFYEEAQKIGGDFARAAPLLKNTAPRSEVALLHDYDSRWAIDFNRFSQRYEQLDILIDYYRVFRDITQSVDIVDPASDLDRYKLVLAPSLNVISAGLARHLAAYVERGGHLVLGPRSGMKNEFNALNTGRQPGLLAPVLGARVEQFYALLNPIPLDGEWGGGTADVWAEFFSQLAPGTKVLMRYGAANGFLDGQPAAVSRKVGRGALACLGAVLEKPLMHRAALAMLADAGIATTPPLPVPDGIEVCRRVGEGRELYIIINHTPRPAAIALPATMRDILAGGETARLTLPPRGVAVLQKLP
ncbi:MAG: beta-galactosidase [Opitutaceae bacterium]|jgi:beta-galactosidase|nr:beta-galactosidase [Opitutaceae bacterium]